MAGLQLAQPNNPTLLPTVAQSPNQPRLSSKVVKAQQPSLSAKVVQATPPQLSPQVETRPAQPELLPVKQSISIVIQEAQRRGASAELILQNIIKANPDKQQVLGEALKRGATAKDILAEIIRQNESSPSTTESEKELRPGIGGIAERFIKGGLSTVADTVKLGFKSITSPVETLKGFGDPIVGLIGKLIPGASTEEQDQIANSVGNYFKERYGGLDAIKKTAYEDPFGFALDVATALDAGAGILSKAGSVSKVSQLSKAGEIASKAGEIVNPINATAKVISKVAKPIAKVIAPRLETSAIKQYSEALGATTKANKIKSEKIVPGLVEKRVTALTKEGLQTKFSAEVEKAGAKLDEAYSNLPQGARTNIKPIFDSLQKKKLQFASNGVVIDESAYKAYDNIQNKLLEVAKQDVSVESMRTLKQIWDKATKRTGKSFGLSDTDSAVAEARKAGANAIRRELAEQFPEVGKVNAEFSFWKNAEDVMKATIERTRSQTGLLEPAAQLAGLATGSTVIQSVLKGIALKNAVKLFRSTGWRTISATQKYRLSKLLIEGQSAEASKMINQLLRGGSLLSRRSD